MPEKLWIYKNCEQQIIEKLSAEAGISRLLAGVFAARGVTDAIRVKDFLKPELDKLYTPFLLKDIEAAVDRILDAIDGGEKILIYGDYDVDGVTSTALLLDFLLSQGADAVFFIPDRFDEGYGLSQGAVEKVIQLGANLVITVDCGITAVDEIKMITDKGIDVIVTDHHECKDVLPQALAVINPHRKDSEYPFKELAGVGVVFKLVHALCIVLGLKDEFLKYLDLVTLGTIADVVRLVEENRIIVKHGLPAIENTENVGLKALIAAAGLKDKPINTNSVGFMLAPRINAAGRTGSAIRAVELLTTNDEKLAENIALELNAENTFRQDTEKEITQQAIAYVESQVKLDEENVIIAVGKGWHHGIIGIVASRITERYYRPCIIISEEDGVGKGSGRSIEGFNLFLALKHCGDLLMKYGGHELAAGLSLGMENIGEFRKRINIYASNLLSEKDLIPRVKIDFTVSSKDISLENVTEIEMLAPFGSGNPCPVFSFDKLKIKDIRGLSENRHLKLKLENDGFFIEAVGFGMGELADTYKAEDYLDAAFALEINTWNNVSKVQMLLKDVRTNKAIVFDSSNGYNINKLAEAAPKREELVAVYQYVKANAAEVSAGANAGVTARVTAGVTAGVTARVIAGANAGVTARVTAGVIAGANAGVSVAMAEAVPIKRLAITDLSSLAVSISHKYGVKLDEHKLSCCLDIFEELKLLNREQDAVGGIVIAIADVKSKVKLEDSVLYRKLQNMAGNAS